MNNAQIYEYYSYGESSSDHKENLEQKQNIMDEKLEKIKKERGIDTNEYETEPSKLGKIEKVENKGDDPHDLEVEMLDKVD